MDDKTGGSIVYGKTGLTLLDYFAGKALHGMLAATDFGKPWGGAKQSAKLSYDFAEAMLAERERGG